MDATVIVALAGLAGTAGASGSAYRLGLATAREETERVRETHAEEERRHRQGTYHQLLTLINELLWADSRQMPTLLERWHLTSAGIALFGAPEVVEKIRPLSQILAEGADRPNTKWREEVIAAARQVASAMRADIGAEDVRNRAGD